MSEVVVLFEDDCHESFARRLLRIGYGYEPRTVRYRRCVDCTGVERAFLEEVEYLRSRNYQRGRALIVIIDADKYGVAGRKQRLAALLLAATMEPRDDAERIAYVVPRLEIENWYMHFCVPARRPIDEEQDYKHDSDWRALVKDLGAAAKTIAQGWAEPGPHAPPSLQDGRRELDRALARVIRRPER